MYDEELDPDLIVDIYDPLFDLSAAIRRRRSG